LGNYFALKFKFEIWKGNAFKCILPFYKGLKRLGVQPFRNDWDWCYSL